MTHCKYIVVELSPGTEVAILFDPCFNHDEMVKGETVLSAGFVDIYDNKVSCFGESVTLKLQARDKDKAIIQRLFFPDR